MSTDTVTDTETASGNFDTVNHVVYAFTGALFIVFSWLIARSGSAPGWEATLFRQINDTSATAADVFWWVMQLGTVIGVVLVTVGLAVFEPTPRKWTSAVSAPVAGLVAWGVAAGLKALVERPRPVVLLGGARIFREPVAIGYGWPSGHTAVAFALATVVALSVPTWARWIPLTIAAFVGAARIVMGAHFPLDVVGGAGIGLVIGSMADLGVSAAMARKRTAHAAGSATT